LPADDLIFSATFDDTDAFPSGRHPGRDELQKLHDETKAHINNILKPLLNLLEVNAPKYVVDTGTANNLIVTPSPPYTTLASLIGVQFYVKVAQKNTGASTVNVNGIGAIPIKKNLSLDLGAGDLPQGAIIGLKYDGTVLQLDSVKRVNPSCKVAQTGSLSVANNVGTAIPFTT
jgi:hypothetical protein